MTRGRRDLYRFSGDRSPVSSRARVLRRLLVGFLVALLVAIVASSLVTIPYYAETPGQGINISTLITVPKRLVKSHAGGVFLTDVDLQRLRAIEYPFFVFNANATIVPAAELAAPGVSNAQYDEEGVIDMTTAREAATVVAMRLLGYDVSAEPAGVAVYANVVRSSSRFSVGDVITAIDGRPTSSLDALKSAIVARRPGASVTVSYHLIGTSTTRSLTAPIGIAATTSSGEPSCEVPGPASKATTSSGPCLGIYTEQIYRTVGLPFSVKLSSGGIIGPSAGLSFTLGLLDKLDKVGLTGGRKIAATGTMSVTGAVGAVGGVAEKTVAVKAAGATVFIVPKGANYRTAKDNAGSGLKVYGVSSAAQALKVLESLGGRLVPRSSR